jgi:hypothetical protein
MNIISTSVFFDTDTVNAWGQVAFSLSAIAAVVWAVVKYAVLKPLDRKIKDATLSIQPNANGGQSLSDINNKVDGLAETVEALIDRLELIEERQVSIYEHILNLNTKPNSRRKSNNAHIGDDK